MPTPEIFDFDESRLALYIPEDMNEQLKSQPSLFVNHLRIAKHLDGWADRQEKETQLGEKYEHFTAALREVAAHLRQGDYLEGGAFMSE